MPAKERARAMRADRKSFPKIAEECGISLGHAYRVAGDIIPTTPTPDATSVIRHHPHNGGCSTQSGMRAIRMPRIVALHGVAT